MLSFNRKPLLSSNDIFAVNGEVRVKRQEDDNGGDEVNAEQLCDGRPADEYFRLSTDGDCRDVVR